MATYTGTSGNDTIVGTSGNDSISGLDGDDSIVGGGGTDTLKGGNGNDTFSASLSDISGLSELVDGEDGYDTLLLTGGGIFDLLSPVLTSVEEIALDSDATSKIKLDQTDLTGVSAMTIDGSAVTSSTHSVTLTAYSVNSGAFNVIGGAGNDWLQGSDSAVDTDTIFGGAGDDTIVSRNGNDILIGGAGADNLGGGDGDDTMVASASDISLLPEVISGSAGTDTLSLIGGGAFDLGSAVFNGVEILQLADNATTSVILSDFAVSSGATMLVDASAITTATNTFTFTASSETDGLFSIIGGAGADTITSGNGSDTIVGGTGADALYGGTGNDVFSASAADIHQSQETINGGDGIDTLSLSGGGTFNLNSTSISNLEAITLTSDVASKVYILYSAVAPGATMTIDASAITTATNGFTFTSANGSDGFFNITGGAGNDSVMGGYKADTIFGSGGNDTMTGVYGNDILSGGDGDDSISGNGDNDAVNGDAGNDSLLGGIGNDTLSGGTGSDTLGGGSGTDRFYFEDVTQGADTITDFTVGTDKIAVCSSNFGDLATGTLGSQYFALAGAETSDTRFVYSATAGVLSYDADGSGAMVGTAIATLTNGSMLSASDILIVA